MKNVAGRVKVENRAPVTLQDVSALDRLVRLVKDSKDKPFVPGEFNRFEAELLERLREAGREVLQQEMSKADIDAEAVLIEGITHRRVLRGTETYMTTLGPVTVERTLYKNRAEPRSKSVAAMDARLGVVGGFWLPEAAKQATWVVSQMTPGLSEELFDRVGNMQPSKSSLDRLPKLLNERWEADPQALEAELRTVTEIPEGTKSLAVSLDGVLAPMKAGGAVETRARAAAEGRVSQGPAGYREVGCATISFCDENGEMISAIRLGRMPEKRKATLKRSILAELGSILAQCPELPVVKIADGAEDNWRFLSEQIPNGAEAIDFFHAAEHLGQAIAAAYGDGTRESRFRFQELREILLEDCGGVERVIRSLTYLRKKHPRSKRIAQVLSYFRKNRKRMRYFEHREFGLPIGSGPVEAACKTLVAQRMKQSGMRWGMEGGQGILTLRGWSQSERFDHAWALLAATYQVQVSFIDNVIAFPTRNLPR
jgi:hypothetical protein